MEDNEAPFDFDEFGTSSQPKEKLHGSYSTSLIAGDYSNALNINQGKKPASSHLQVRTDMLHQVPEVYSSVEVADCINKRISRRLSAMRGLDDHTVQLHEEDKIVGSAFVRVKRSDSSLVPESSRNSSVGELPDLIAKMQLTSLFKKHSEDEWEESIQAGVPEEDEDEESDSENGQGLDEETPLDVSSSFSMRDLHAKDATLSGFLCRKLVKAHPGLNRCSSWAMGWVELRGDMMCFYGSDARIPMFKNTKSKQLVVRSPVENTPLIQLIQWFRKKNSKPNSPMSSPTEAKHVVGHQDPRRMRYNRKPLLFVIHLKNCRVAPIYDVDREYSFKIITSRKFEVLVSCDSLQKMNEWVNIIKEEIQGASFSAIDFSSSSGNDRPRKKFLLRKKTSQVKPSVTTRSLFASTLDEYHSRTGKYVPMFLRKAFAFIEKNGIDNEGLYRIPGNSNTVSEIKEKLNQNEFSFQFVDSDALDINVVCGLIKLYFRELKVPLLRYENFDVLIKIGSLSDQMERINSIIPIVQALPEPYYRVLKALLKHLYNIQLQKEKNKMSAANLAMIFGPAIIRPASEDVQYFLQIPKITVVLETMILHRKIVLGLE